VPLVVPDELPRPLVPLPVVPLLVVLVPVPLEPLVVPVFAEFMLLLPVPIVADDESPVAPVPVVPVPPMVALPLSELDPPMPGDAADDPEMPGETVDDPAVPLETEPPVLVPGAPATPAPENPTQSGVSRCFPVAASQQSARKCVLLESKRSELVVPVVSVSVVAGVVMVPVDDAELCAQAGAAVNAAQAASAAASRPSMNACFMKPPVNGSGDFFRTGIATGPCIAGSGWSALRRSAEAGRCRVVGAGLSGVGAFLRSGSWPRVSAFMARLLRFAWVQNGAAPAAEGSP
jgi:hypothetical protein